MIDFLAVKRGGTYVDATVGLGGHSYEIAKRLGAAGHLIGFDKDAAALARAAFSLQPSVVSETAAERGSSDEPRDWPTVSLIHGSFAEVGERVAPASLDGILADLGVSSLQLGDAARGFSFQAE
ncbi:MAG: 16S rRNA (cytosine(1402)-N(4))-methyltransferase, partial [Terriglobales bacterium]